MPNYIPILQTEFNETFIMCAFLNISHKEIILKKVTLTLGKI